MPKELGSELHNHCLTAWRVVRSASNFSLLYSMSMAPRPQAHADKENSPPNLIAKEKDSTFKGLSIEYSQLTRSFVRFTAKPRHRVSGLVHAVDEASLPPVHHLIERPQSRLARAWSANRVYTDVLVVALVLFSDILRSGVDLVFTVASLSPVQCGARGSL